MARSTACTILGVYVFDNEPCYPWKAIGQVIIEDLSHDTNLHINIICYNLDWINIHHPYFA